MSPTASTREIVIRKILAAMSVIMLGCYSAAAAAKPNLVLITLDSARADRMGFLGAKGILTPNLDRLAKESIVFEHAYSQSPSSVVSHATILSGSYPQSTGISSIGGALSPALLYLPDLLKAQGFRTAAFVSSIDLDPQNGLAQGFDRGFQTYDAGFKPALPGDLRPPITERPADLVVARAITWLDHNAQSQFFLWIHLPGARASDADIGKLIAALQQRKLYANTATIVLAGHGESLGAHGEETHGIFLYDETIHVPLLLRLPEGGSTAKPAATIRVAAKARLVDIAPTLLEIAAIPVPSQMQGQSLLRIAKAGGGNGSVSDQPVYSRSDLPQRGFGWSPLESWRAGKYVYIRAPKPELYDVTADPAAAHNLAQTSKATLDTMAAQLDNFDRHFSGEAGKVSAELSSSEMQKLASLGYIGLQKSSAAASTVTGTDPKDKIATANKVIAAALASERSKSDPAIVTLQQVLSADPYLYLAQYALGVALARKAQYTEAAKHLHQAVELQPDSAWAHFEIGACLVKTGDFKTAVVHLEIAAGRLPALAPAHHSLAEAYEHLGRTEDAKRERARATNNP
ncbi:MAG: sulfatase-like hydrolase/transferase [Terriglobales bacterium]|jgi:arylsulfatase A-like enzyme/Tfp pilus assembly protein PilF